VHDAYELLELLTGIRFPVNAMMYMEAARFVDLQLVDLTEEFEGAIDLAESIETGQDRTDELGPAPPYYGTVLLKVPGVAVSTEAKAVVQAKLIDPPVIAPPRRDIVRLYDPPIEWSDDVVEAEYFDLHAERSVRKIPKQRVLLPEL
jgi:hypothetical protein